MVIGVKGEGGFIDLSEMVIGWTAEQCETWSKIAGLALAEYRRQGFDRWPPGVQAMIDHVSQADRKRAATGSSVNATGCGGDGGDRETIAYVTVIAAAERRGVSASWVRYLAANGQIPGAFQRKPGSPWLIPEVWVEEVFE